MPKAKTLHASPEAVEHAFYDALEHADLDTFMQIWADDEDIVCVVPGGPRLAGHHAIREAWRIIFSNGPVHARPSQFQVIQGATVSVHSLITQIIVNDQGGQTRVVNLNVTNIFMKGPQGWRLILHHASPAQENNNATGPMHRPGGPPPTILH
jgi:uncharacterized protein (TIGR02246 family)